MVALARPMPADLLGGQVFPYGASELKRLQPIYLRRALALACLVALTVWVLGMWVAGILSRPHLAPDSVPYPTIILPPPPSLRPHPTPQVGIAVRGEAPPIAAPLPVPNALAPLDRTIPPNEDFNPPGPDGGPPGKTQVVVIPPEEPDPDPNGFIYTDEYPVLIHQVQPVYPEIARQAGLEGVVSLRILLDTDGRVKRVIVDKSIPVLDGAATDAVRQWVFKPARSNNRPVKVWVRVPVRFSLR